MKHHPLNKLGFLLGDWNLDYNILKSSFSEAKTDSGNGSIKKILNDQYLQFEYSTQSGGEARGIFARDENIKMFKYWWFENSGVFQTVSCNLTNDHILAMNWCETLFVQTFKKLSTNRLLLAMQHPGQDGGYDIVMEVVLIKFKAT